MKILVTGGAGYIGSHTIIEILETTTHEVVAIDNFCNSSSETVDRIEQITGKRVPFYPIDLCDFHRLKSEFFDQVGQIDGIIHFAALKAVGDSVEQPLLYYGNNVNSLVNVLRCAEEYGVKSLIFSSSCTVYGNALQQPVTEETPIQQAESPYGFTKWIGEKILSDFTTVHPNFRSISLRYFNPVGAHPSGEIGEWPKGKPNNLVPIITQFASGWLPILEVYGSDYATRDGTPVRDYIHVCDIARAHVLAIEHLESKELSDRYSVFNLGNGRGVTVLEVLKSFEEATGEKLAYNVGPRRPGDVECIYANAEKAHKVLKWKPKFSIQDAMRSAWAWQQRLNLTIGDDRARSAKS